jgi:site-specific DNA-methyltransferase (adenine-specific)/modification methylase
MTFRKEVLAEGVECILGDCIEVLPALGRFDACVTDPPYGIGFSYNLYVDTPENLERLIAGFVEVCRAKADRVVITPGLTNLFKYPVPDWIGSWTWETTATYGALGYNQWQPILFYGTEIKGFGSVNGVLKADRIHFTGGSAQIQNDKDGDKHPCPKPLAFVQRVISRFSYEGGAILEPFMGSGTTGVAAVKLGRKFTGIEIDPGYFDIACRRIEAALKQPDMFIDPPKPMKQEALL